MRVLNMKQPSPSTLVAFLSFTKLQTAESLVVPASLPPGLDDLNLKMDIATSEVEGRSPGQPAVVVQEFLPKAYLTPRLDDLSLMDNITSEPPMLDDTNLTMGNTTSEAGGELSWRPVVYVQDFLPYFPHSPPPKLDNLNLTMDAIYGYKVCPGNEDFVDRVEDAPPDFCRYSNGELSMAMEADDSDAPADGGAPSLDARNPEEPSPMDLDAQELGDYFTIEERFRGLVGGVSHQDFDQYSMERIMLAKWLSSPLRCRGEEAWCRANADVVVVPSYVYHLLLQQGFHWRVTANGTGAAAYWATIREMFYSPETNRTPLIVTHSAYAWDRKGYNEVLHALAEEPVGFIQRVVIASTGSNLKPPERELFGGSWSDGGISLLRQRFEQRRSGAVVSDGGPLLLTVPYPTSLLENTPFTESDEHYSADRKRPIRVSLFASATKNGRGSNWIRQLLLDHIVSKPHSETYDHVSMVCRRTESVGEDTMCGLSPNASANMWTLASNSAFCVEPPGDTLCRSHFYIALLSGCIPVIVDGGHDAYDPATPTWWAWRGTSQDLSSPSPFPDELASALVDYNETFVVISADDVRAGKDHILELARMPEQDPERFRRLRENVDRIAPLMRYSYQKCSEYPWSRHPAWCRDAFAAFQSIVAFESYYAQN